MPIELKQLLFAVKVSQRLLVPGSFIMARTRFCFLLPKENELQIELQASWLPPIFGTLCNHFSVLHILPPPGQEGFSVVS